MKYNIIDIREDDEGYLWFLAENYYDGESWWLHLSDEYSHTYELNDDDLTKLSKRYELKEIEK